MDYETSWREYVGVSLSTIENGSDRDIRVVVPELTPFLSGEIDGSFSEFNMNLEDIIAGVKRNDKIIISKSISATYFGRDNFSVPCIHYGEIVRVLNYGGTWKHFYWMPMGKNDSIRELERMRWYVADVRKTVKQYNEDNTYFIEMDTSGPEKHILLKTCKSDGEPFRYEIRVNTTKGIVTITDDADNWIRMTSLLPGVNVPEIWAHNNRNTNIQMIGEHINANSISSINFKTNLLTIDCTTMLTNVAKLINTTCLGLMNTAVKEGITTSCEKTILINSVGNMTLTTGAAFVASSVGAMTLTGTAGFTYSSSATIIGTAPTITVTGTTLQTYLGTKFKVGASDVEIPGL